MKVVFYDSDLYHNCKDMVGKVLRCAYYSLRDVNSCPFRDMHILFKELKIQFCVFSQPLGFRVQCSISSIRRCFSYGAEVREFLVKCSHSAQMNRSVCLKLATWVFCCLVSLLCSCTLSYKSEAIF